MKNVTLGFAIVLCMISSMLYGQSKKETKILIEDYFKKARSGESGFINAQSYLGYESYVLAEAKPFLDDTVIFVRYKAMDLIKRTGIKSVDPEIRTKSVAFLIEAIKDKDSGNSGFALKSLKNFNKSDFNSIAVDSINALIGNVPYHLSDFHLIVGFAGNGASKDKLVSVLKQDNKRTQKETWFLHLALARLGSQESIQYCLAKVDNQELNDQLVYFILPDIAYIRQPDAFKYLESLIRSESTRCAAANADTEGSVKCAFKVMVLVAPYIANFPVKTDQYGDADITNYEQALIEVRQWFLDNPLYVLKLEQF